MNMPDGSDGQKLTKFSSVICPSLPKYAIQTLADLGIFYKGGGTTGQAPGQGGTQ